MTAVKDALREMAAECEKALAVRKTTVGAKWCLERCRAALAEAEKDESELLAALKALYAACEHRANTEGGDFGEIIGPAAEQAEQVLSKHAKKD